MLYLTQLRSPDLTLEISEMVKWSWVTPESFHTKNGLNGRTEFITTSSHRNKFVVCPYYIYLSVVNYYHLRNPVTRSLLADLVPSSTFVRSCYREITMRPYHRWLTMINIYHYIKNKDIRWLLPLSVHSEAWHQALTTIKIDNLKLQ